MGWLVAICSAVAALLLVRCVSLSVKLSNERSITARRIRDRAASNQWSFASRPSESNWRKAKLGPYDIEGE